jgi:hypothetical protein
MTTLNDLLQCVDIDENVNVYQFYNNDIVLVPRNEYFMSLGNTVLEISIRDNKLNVYIDNKVYTVHEITCKYAIDNLLSHVNDICNKYNMTYTVDGDTITIKLPMHCIEIVIIDNTDKLHDGDYNYDVYRNGMLMFSSNDSYDELFFQLLDTTLSNL